jgi:hypothetical protein
VLADWLDEHGEYQAADFTRRTRMSREGDLDVAIRQVPCPEVALLGCEFVEHAALQVEPKLVSHLAAVRRFFEGDPSRQRWELARRELDACFPPPMVWHNFYGWVDNRVGPGKLEDAVRGLIAALGAVEPGRETDIAGAQVAVTSCARSVRSSGRFESRSSRDEKELQWQIKQTRRLLSELAARAECTSP